MQQSKTKVTIRRTNRHKQATRVEKYRFQQNNHISNVTGYQSNVINHTNGNGSSGRRRLVIRNS